MNYFSKRNCESFSDSGSETTRPVFIIRSCPEIIFRCNNVPNRNFCVMYLFYTRDLFCSSHMIIKKNKSKKSFILSKIRDPIYYLFHHTFTHILTHILEQPCHTCNMVQQSYHSNIKKRKMILLRLYTLIKR